MRSLILFLALGLALVSLPLTCSDPSPGPGGDEGGQSAVASSSRRGTTPTRFVRILRVVWRIGAAFLVVCALMLVFEGCFIYFPTNRPVRGNWSTPGGEECRIATSDGLTLHGWWHGGAGSGDASSRPVVLWFHGNAGNITHREENLQLLAHQGLAVFLVDYRGYGLSEGKPSEKGLYADGEAAYRYLVEERAIEPNRIVCFGRSLGAGVALHVALEHEVAALIMESPFASVPAMARKHYPFLPVWFLLRNRYDSLGKVPELKVPLLVLHGDRDSIVPLKHGKAVYEAAPEPKEFYTIVGAGHNDTYYVGGGPYFRKLREFCYAHVAQPATGGSPMR
jgi:fermentation-respiration switch protein FrsA (DUF1100 family)